jgi:sugar lactone lactonase YvrE
VTAPGLDHQVASPFWTFMNSSGPVYQDGGVTTAALFPNPFYATGLPVTEAYWASVKVAGTYRNVLMQCFERRCLTYTPGNPAGFETEAGNVGQHYHDWRYGSAVTPPATHYAFAGAFGYSADSTLALQSPAGIAIGQHGEITVADAGNYRVAFYTPDGAHEGSVGSKGAGDGQFNSPVDVAYDADGDLFIADRGNHRVVKLTGITFSAFGSTGSGSAALDPACVAVHADLVYVCDLANNRIARFTTAGAYVDSFGNTGSGSSLLVEPFSIAVDAAGTTYVTDMGAPNGEGRVAVFSAGLTYQRDLPIPAGYDYVYCVRVAPDGSIYALDDASRITHYASDGTFIGVWATTEFFASVMSNPGEFMIDGAGNFYVSGVDMARAYGVPGYQYVGMVIRFDASAHPTLILTDDNRYSFDHPVDIAVGTDGNLLISDTTANVSRVDAWAPDGQPAVRDGLRISAGASPSVSTGIAVAPNGTLYVVDAGNNRVLHFDTRWKLLQGFDGTGSSNGPLVAPHGVAVDASGNVYVVDQGNGLIRKFTSDGTDLGSWGSTGDGPGQFAIPMDIAISGQRVYVTDWDLDRVDVFDLNGQYLTSWGSYGAGQGQFDSPRGVAVDAAGYVYVVDSENARVQKFAPDGTWLATFGGGGDKPLHLPQGIAVGPNGEVYVVDSGNQRVVAYAPQ